jgi:ribosomal protein S18 acetylase RimI-like enzyme
MNFRSFTKNDTPQIVNLLNICFPGKNITPNSFNWKHFHNYFNNLTQSYVATTDDDQIVCFVCFVPMNITYKSTSVFYFCAVQATHPNYRRQGLVKTLTQIIEKKLPKNQNYLGFSNTDGVKIDRFSKTINYRIIGQLSTRFLIPRPHLSTYQFIPSTELSFDTISGYIQIYKNQPYLNWRYFQNPKNKYQIFDVLYHQQKIGSIIYKKKLFRGELCDINLKTNNPKTWQSVISDFAFYCFLKGQLFSSLTFLPNKFWTVVFPNKFPRINIDIYLTVKSVNNYYQNPNHWLIQGGDIQ